MVGLYTELFYAIIPTLFLGFAALLSLNLITFLKFYSLVYRAFTIQGGKYGYEYTNNI